MTSLRGYLPPAGSTLWGKERRSSSAESGHGPTSLITHVVIREVWKKETPSPHALYKIDVMTKSNHWFVLKRYREFSCLHKKLVASYCIPKDMLPPKKLTSKMSLKHLERRRDALEHYLQRLVNSSTYVSSSPEILDFLDVGGHDVMAVTKALATELLATGEKILDENCSYTFSLTELYSITQQLQLPEPTQTSEEHSPLDLGHLYNFVYHLEDLCVSSVTKRSKNSQELASHLEFDVSLFKALRSLKIDSCPVNLMKGLSSLQGQLKYLGVQQSLKTMRELLVDRVVEKRKASFSGSRVASWRSQATARLTQNRVILQPWVQLTNLTLSHNALTTFDESMKLMPALQSLDLSYNNFVSLDLLEMNCPSLTHLDLSHNAIHFISGSPKNLNNLKSLVLDHNNIQTLTGLESLIGLIELNIASNQISGLKEILCLSGMSQLRYLSVDDNPLTKVKSYRLQIFSYFKGQRIVLDNKSRTSEEKNNLSIWPVRSRSLTSPQKFEREESEKVVRLVRAHSYDALGNAHDDDDDHGINDDDEDSGIEGYTPSVTGIDTLVEGGDEGKQEDLKFNWSYYDFLDMSGSNMASSLVLGNENQNENARQETSRNDVFSSVTVTGELEEKASKEPKLNDTLSSELEERVGEDMCQEKSDRTSSTETASEVSVNGDNSQSNSINNQCERELLPESVTCLPGNGMSDSSTYCNDNIPSVSDQGERELLPGSVTCLPGNGMSDSSTYCNDNIPSVSDQGERELLPGSVTCLPGNGMSDSSTYCNDNIPSVSDLGEMELLPGSVTCLPGNGMSDSSTYCNDNIPSVSDQGEMELLPGSVTCLPGNGMSDSNITCTGNILASVDDQEDMQ